MQQATHKIPSQSGGQRKGKSQQKFRKQNEALLRYEIVPQTNQDIKNCHQLR